MGGNPRAGASKRAALLEAGIGRAAAGGLADYLKFVGVAEVAEAAGASEGVLYHHFPTKRGGRDKFLGEIVRTALGRLTVSEATIEVVNDAMRHFAAGDTEAGLRAVSRAASTDVEAHSRGPGAEAYSLNLVAGAAAANDPVAARILAELYDTLLDLYVETYDELLAAWGRMPRSPYTVRDVAKMITALVDGWALRMRFDPAATPEILADLVKGIIAIFTMPIEDGGDHRELDELLGLRPAPPLDAERQAWLDPVVETARALYADGGWDAVHLGPIARRAGVEPAVLLTMFPNRSHLAGPVWAGFLPELQAGLDDDARRRTVEQVRRHLRRIADLVVNHHRRLTGALLEAVYAKTMQSGRPTYGDLSDPRTWVPLPPMLVPTLQAGANAFRPELKVDTTEGALDLATFLTNTLLNRAITRPDADVDEIAEYVFDVCMSGAAAPRRRR